jgi:Acetyltransferase (GNAT) domain
VSGTLTLPVKGEYHDNFLTAQASARGTLDRDAQKNLFDRLDWLDSLHRIALRDRAPLLLRASDGDNDLWMPLMKTGPGTCSALANWYNFTWRPIFGGRYDEVTRLTLLRQIAQQAPEHARRIVLSPVPDEDSSASLLATAFEHSGWIVSRKECDENHYLNVRGRSFDQYWEGRPGQLRNTVKRKGKKGVVSIRIESDFAKQSWADYERIYARSWKPHEGNPEFLRKLAEQEAVAGCLRLGLAYIEGQPVAAQFWTVENGVALIHKLAHDERQLAASPGTLLSAAMFQHVIDIDKVDEIDFGTGSDPYKREWMEEMRPRYAIELLWPNHVLNWPRIIRNKILPLKELP